MTTDLHLHDRAARAGWHLLTASALQWLIDTGEWSNRSAVPLAAMRVHREGDKYLLVVCQDTRRLSSGETALWTLLEAFSTGRAFSIAELAGSLDDDNRKAVHEALGIYLGVESETVSVPLLGSAW